MDSRQLRCFMAIYEHGALSAAAGHMRLATSALSHHLANMEAELGTRLYGGGAGTVGLLYSAVGVGGLMGALTTGWVGRVQRPGRAVEIAVVIWGFAIAGFGLTSWLPLGLVLLAAAGAAGDV